MGPNAIGRHLLPRRRQEGGCPRSPSSVPPRVGGASDGCSPVQSAPLSPSPGRSVGSGIALSHPIGMGTICFPKGKSFPRFREAPPDSRSPRPGKMPQSRGEKAGGGGRGEKPWRHGFCPRTPWGACELRLTAPRVTRLDSGGYLGREPSPPKPLGHRCRLGRCPNRRPPNRGFRRGGILRKPRRSDRFSSISGERGGRQPSTSRPWNVSRATRAGAGVPFWFELRGPFFGTLRHQSRP